MSDQQSSDPIPKGRRLSVRALLGESLSTVVARPARTTLTVLGTVLGVAALVATLGVAQSAAAQIGFELDALRPTSVTATVRIQTGGITGAQPLSLPRDAVVRATRLNGVVAATTLTELQIDPIATTRASIDPADVEGRPIQIFATSPSLLDVIDGQLATGTFLDPIHDAAAHPVAVLGPLAAERLQIAIVDQQPAIFVGTQPLTIIGILRDDNLPDGLVDSVLISDGTANAIFGWTAVNRLLIRTDIGAAQQVASEIRLALSPDTPEDIESQVPPEPSPVRTAVQEQVNLLIIALGGIALLIGGLGIANVTLVSVLERTNEIGIRRALGARRGQIALQFLTESAVLGAAGGALGSSIGVATVVTIAAIRDWVPVMEAWVPLSAPLLGLAIGALAGLYPAARAASMDAAQAIRTGAT